MKTVRFGKIDYILPEGLNTRIREDRVGKHQEIYDDNGSIYTFQPAVSSKENPCLVADLRGKFERYRLEPVVPQQKPDVNTGHAWELSHKILRTLMKDGVLVSDHKDKLEIMEAEFESFGDESLKEYVLPRIKNVVSHYVKRKEWDFRLLGK